MDIYGILNKETAFSHILSLYLLKIVVEEIPDRSLPFKNCENHISQKIKWFFSQYATYIPYVRDTNTLRSVPKPPSHFQLTSRVYPTSPHVKKSTWYLLLRWKFYPLTMIHKNLSSILIQQFSLLLQQIEETKQP